MAAILRLKRRITDEPPETILVSCSKRKKCEDGSASDSEKAEENVTTQVLKFAGTVPDKNEEISKHIRKAIKKEKLEKEYKLHVGSDVLSQNRILKKISSSKNRYHIVSQLRAKHLDKIDELDDEEAEAAKKDAAESSEKKEKIFCLYDMEQNVISDKVPEEEIVTCNSVPMVKEKVASPVGDMDKGYVYDLYYINQPHFNYSWLENIPYVDIYRQDDNFMNDQYSDPEDIYEDDDDDSNDENNWRNDYPDEDPRFYDPVVKHDDDDTDEDDGHNYFSKDDEDEDNDLAAKLERCFLGKVDEEEDDDDDEDRGRYNYYDCNRFSSPYPRHTSYENYMERVRKELSDT